MCFRFVIFCGCLSWRIATQSCCTSDAGEACTSVVDCKQNLYCSEPLGKCTGYFLAKEGDDCDPHMPMCADTLFCKYDVTTFKGTCQKLFNVEDPCAFSDGTFFGCKLGDGCHAHNSTSNVGDDKCMQLFSGDEYTVVSNVLFCKPWLILDPETWECRVPFSPFTCTKTFGWDRFARLCGGDCLRIGSDDCLDPYRESYWYALRAQQHGQVVASNGLQILDQRKQARAAYELGTCLKGSPGYTDKIVVDWSWEPITIIFLTGAIFFMVTTGVVIGLLILQHRRYSENFYEE